MGKRHKAKLYSVRKISGVKRDEETGEIMCLVKWSGYSQDCDSWEPLSNLSNVECMIHAYLTSHNISLESILTTTPECPACSSGTHEPFNIALKGRKVATKTVTEPKQSPIEDQFVYCLSPVKPEPEPATINFAEKLVFQANTPRPFLGPVGGRAGKQSLFQYPMFADIKPEPKGKCQRSEDVRKYFSRIALVPGRLGVDRPIKILGVRGGENGLEYAILFAASSDKYVGVGVALHQDLIAQASWLFARFFLSNNSVTHA